MASINDIYRITYKMHSEFRGTLRNERRFELHQRVFVGVNEGGFSDNNELVIYPAIIKGIQDDKDYMNPTYIYDVQIPEWAVKERISRWDKQRAEEKLEAVKDIPKYRVWKRYKIQRDCVNIINGYNNNSNMFTYNCEHIFESAEQAEESARKNLQHKYELNRDNLERFFAKFYENAEKGFDD